MSALRALFRREITLRRRQGGWAVGAGLFAAIGALAPLAIGNEPELLRTAGPGLLWIVLGLSVFLGTEGLFEDDLQNGALEQFALSPFTLSQVVLIKLLAAWGFMLGPILLAAPLLLLGYGAPLLGLLGLSLASLGLVFVSGTVAALTSGQRRGGPVLVFCALPLIIPALVFGPQADGTSLVPFLILGAYSLQAAAICPFLAAASLRLHMQ